MVYKQEMLFILRFLENNTLKCKKYMYSYLYALIQKLEFGPIIARAKPRRGMLVYNINTLQSTKYDTKPFLIEVAKLKKIR